MPNFSDVIGIPKKLTQNTVDYIAKQFQVYYDAIFGKDTDNDNLPALPPYILNGNMYVKLFTSDYLKTTDDSAPSGSVIFTAGIPVHITSYNSPSEYLGDPFLVPAMTSEGNNRQDVISNWNNFFLSHENKISTWYQLSDGTNFAPPISPRTSGSSYHYLGCTLDNKNYINIYDGKSIFTTRTAKYCCINPTIRFESNNIPMCYDVIRDDDINIFLSNQSPLFTTTTVTYPYTTTGNQYNTYNVTNKYGDEITIYYNDNQVIMPISPNISSVNVTNNFGGVNINPDIKIGGIGGIGGIAVGGAGAIVNGELDLGGINFGLGGLNLGGLNLDVDMGGLTYNDIRDMFNNVLIKVNELNSEDPEYIPIEFPTYGDIKYTDRGNFYIEPIHQIDKLPTAPELNNIDTNIDFNDIGTFVGGSVNTMLDIYSGLGISSTLILSCLLITFLIKKLRGD